MKRLALLLLLFVTSFAYSAGKCYQWQQGGGPWLDSAEAVTKELVDYCNSSPATGTAQACTTLSQLTCGSPYGACSSSRVSVTATAFPTYTVVVQTYRAASDTQPAAGPWQRTLTLNYRENPNGCPDCATYGTKQTMTGTASSFTDIPASQCNGGCLYTLSSEVSILMGNTYAADYVSAGVACSQTTSGNTLNTTGSASDCVYKDGVMACRDRTSGSDCNQFNGELICTHNVLNGCIETASGAVACTKGAAATTTTTPGGGAPNNGTAGQATTPAAKQTYGSSSSSSSQLGFDYYTPSQVAGSAGGTGGSSSSSSSGGGSSSSASSGSSSSGSTCTSNCDFSQPANEDVPTVAQTTSTYSSRINNAPIMLAVSGIGASLPSGVCPSGSVTLFGHSITLDIQCTLWDQIAPILSLVFLAGWAFTGLRIIMSA